MVGLDVVVNDPLVDRERYPAASRLITNDLDYGALCPAPGDFVVIATQHKGDHMSMKRALLSGVRYIALIASRKRSRLVLDYLRQEGIGDQEIERVMAPSGLDLGARTPEEIALCVISEIVLVRRGGTGLRMRDKLRDEREKSRLKAARV
jgi:xanthine dehydrogenase accessory factor